MGPFVLFLFSLRGATDVWLGARVWEAGVLGTHEVPVDEARDSQEVGRDFITAAAR